MNNLSFDSSFSIGTQLGLREYSRTYSPLSRSTWEAYKKNWSRFLSVEPWDGVLRGAIRNQVDLEYWLTPRRISRIIRREGVDNLSPRDDLIARRFTLSRFRRPAEGVIADWNSFYFSRQHMLPNGLSADDNSGGLRITDARLDETAFPRRRLIGPQGGGDSVSCIKALPNGQLVSGDERGRIQIWDAGSTTEIASLADPHLGAVKDILAISNNQIVSCHWNGTVCLWNLDDDSRLLFSGGVDSWNGELNRLADGTIILVTEYRVYMWHPNDRQHRTNPLIIDSEDPIVGHILMDNNRLGLVSRSATGESYLETWHQGVQKSRVQLADVISCVTRLSAHQFLLGFTNGSVQLWNTQNPARTLLTGHTSQINCARLSDDGRWLAVGAHNAMVRIWDLKNPQRSPKVIEAEFSARAISAFNQSRGIQGLAVESRSDTNSIHILQIFRPQYSQRVTKITRAYTREACRRLPQRICTSFTRSMNDLFRTRAAVACVILAVALAVFNKYVMPRAMGN